MASSAAAASAAVASTVETHSTHSPSTISIKETLEAYLKCFNKHETAEYIKFYAEDINVHLPAFPPMNSRTELEAIFRMGLSYFSERIRPTFFIVGEKAIAMEAKMECVAVEAVDFKFPFTGKIYKKGEEFAYEIVYVLFPIRLMSMKLTSAGVYIFSVHYEFNDDGLIQAWRAFSVVQYPDPGAGIKKEVLPGWWKRAPFSFFFFF